MKVILSATSADIDSPVDSRFGRAEYFILAEVDTLEWQAFPNPGANARGGAGVQAAQFVSDHNCEAVISGDFGPVAYDVLRVAGLEMYIYGSCSSVREAIQKFNSGQMEAMAAPAGAD